MIKKIFIFLILFFSFFVVSQAALATTIFSPLIEMEAEPGESLNGVVKVFNETDDTLILSSSVEPFTANGEKGQPVYLPIEQKDKYLDWFEISQDDLLLKSKQVAIVPFSLEVPQSAVPGGYYAVIFWKDITKEINNPQAVSISSKVGTLIFLKVKGDLAEIGETEFFIKENKNLFFQLPINFVFRFENLGNIHLKPTGQIEITNWFGQTEIIKVNPTNRNVLPETARQFDFIWGPTSNDNFLNKVKFQAGNLIGGKYKAVLKINYGVQNQQEVIKEINFWVVPIHLLSFIFLSIIILVIFIKINSKIKKLKKTNVS